MDRSAGGSALDAARQELHHALQELLDLAKATEHTLAALDALVSRTRSAREGVDVGQADPTDDGPDAGPDGVESGSVEWERRVDELMGQLEALMVKRARLAAAIGELRAEAMEAGGPAATELFQAIRDIDARSLQRAHGQLRWWHSQLEQIRGRRVAWQGYRLSLGKQERRSEFVDRRV